MGITALNIHATSNYVSKEDSGYSEDGNHSSEATVWELGAMDSYIQSYVSSKSTSFNMKSDTGDTKDMNTENASDYFDVSVDVHGMALDTCRLCLRGWSNFKDTNGNDIEFKTKKMSIKGRMYNAVDPDLMAAIPKDIIMELYGEINRISDLTDTEIKN